jgi:hypothetical protein
VAVQTRAAQATALAERWRAAAALAEKRSALEVRLAATPA